MSEDLLPVTDGLVMNHLSEGVIIAESNGRVVYSNETARMLLGADPSGRSLVDLRRQLMAHMSQESSAPAEDEWRILRRDGRTLTVRMLPEQGPDGSLTHILITPAEAPSPSEPSQNSQSGDQRSLSGHASSSSEKKLRILLETIEKMGWSRVFLALGDQELFGSRLLTMGGVETDSYQLNSVFPPSWVRAILLAPEETLPAKAGSIYLLDQDRNTLERYTTGEMDHATSEPGPVRAWHPGAILCIPLFSPQQERLGWLGVARPWSNGAPGSDDLTLLHLQARLAALEIEGARASRKTETRNQQLENLLRANRGMSGELEKESLLALLGDQMLRTAGADSCRILEWDREKDALVMLWSHPPFFEPSTDTPGTHWSLEAAHSLRAFLEAEDVPFAYYKSSDFQSAFHGGFLGSARDAANILYLPLRFADYTYGLIELIFNYKDVPAEDTLFLLAALVEQAGATLETALMFEDTVDREHFYNAMGRVSLAMNFALAKQSVLDLIALESLRIFGVEGAYVFQAEEDSFVAVAAAGAGGDSFIGTSLPAESKDAFVLSVAEKGEPEYLNQLGKGEKSRLHLPESASLSAVLGIPIEQDGVVSGVLVLVAQSKPDRFGEKDLTRGSVFGAQIALALRNASLFEELRSFNEELDRRVAERTQALNEESNRVKILLRITSELSASLDQEHVINRALGLVKEAVEATEGVILLINPETDDLEFRATLGSSQRPALELSPTGLKRDAGLAGWMIDNRSPVVVEDTRLDARWIDLPRSRAFRSVLGVPLITGEEVIGVLMLFHTDVGAFTAQQMDLVEAAAIQVANALNNANLYLLIRDQAESLGKVLLAEQIEAAKSQSILESIADGVVVADADSRIILANLAASAILELPRQGVIGKSINELLGLYGQSGRSWMTIIGDWAANADRIEQGTFLSDELAIEDKVVSVHLSPVLAGRQYFGTVSVFRDITQNVELDKLKSEFVSTVSHELRTPMTSIKGYAELMLMGAAGKMTETQSRYLQVISNNAERLHFLVNDLLDISRMDTGKTELELRPTHVARIVDQVVEGHLRGRIQHEKKEIAVFVEIAPALPLVIADQVRFSQILTNLLDNAFNYTPEHGEIHVHARALDGFVQIGVSDSGIGIPHEIQPKIFERFFRADDAIVQQIPGTGLGLAIVRSLVNMHGGRLELESAPGKGSKFTFTLPVVLEDSEPT